MMRRLPLRSRLALLSSLAVTIAIAAVALVSWYAVRERLYDQMDKSINSQDAPRQPQLFLGYGSPSAFGGLPGPGLYAGPCDHPKPSNLDGQVFDQPPLTSVTYVGLDGSYCAINNSTRTQAEPADLQLAGSPPGTSKWRDGVDPNGQPVRVEVVPDPSGTGVFLKSQPFEPIDDSLTSLAWLLVAVSGLGVAGAVASGLLVARAALRPVDDLAEAVEHVARTEDLTVRMPVSGDDEVARLSESFNAMTAALQASREEQKRLVDDAGHELRTPLTSLRTTIDLLIRSEESGRPLPDGKRAELLTGARTQMRELTVLIADLLELSRPEQATPAVATPVALHEVTARAVERVRPRGAARETPVTLAAELRPWTAHGDAAALERAVVNLLDNAVKFAPPGSQVDVRLAAGDLTVRDRGPGIAPEELAHVFERFWRSPSARALPGSGLGLAIAARVARESGGSVTLEAPHDGPGTIARLRLPGSVAGQVA